MKQPEDADRHATPLEARKVARKPYQKPAVRHEQVFETSALYVWQGEHHPGIVPL